MTTIVIKDGVIYTDTKLTDVDAEASKLLKGHIKNMYLNGNSEERRAVKLLTASKFFDCATFNYNVSNGKFIKTDNLYFKGMDGEVTGITFAGCVNVAPIIEGYLKENKEYSFDNFIQYLYRSDVEQYNASCKHYTTSGVMNELEVALATLAFVAVTTTEKVYTFNRKNVIEPSEGFVSHWFPKNQVITFGSGPDNIKGLERQYQCLSEGRYLDYYIEHGIETEQDVERYFEFASKLDPMTNDNVVSSK